MENTTNASNNVTKTSLLKRTSFFRIRTTVGKMEKYSSAIFILSSIETLFTLVFVFFVVPQLTALDKALTNQKNWLSWFYLCILGLIIFVQVIYGVYLRHHREQGNEISNLNKLIAVSGMIIGFVLFSFFIEKLIIIMLSPVYKAINR